MLCMPFLAKARRGLVVSATLLLAILALPPGASARAHGAAVAQHPSAAIVRVGDGYASRGGSRAVRWVQRRLYVLGYEAGPTDGLFGPLTEAAVTRFQLEHRLRIDGVVGPVTAARLRAVKPVAKLGTGYRTPRGSQRVRTIQRRLRALGYAPGPVDGRFGPRTERAVTLYQAEHRLVADGEVGAKTSKRMLPQATPSTPSHVDDRTSTRRPAVPDLPSAERPTTLRPAPRASLPHGPPVEAVLIALAIVGLAVFTGSYLRTRAQIAKAARAQRAVPTVNGSAGGAR
jgi:peptidoglycan hydrolase-like protein with peptidoglycan-binding domain